MNLAPTIVSGTATVYPRSNWPATTAPSGTPVGSSATSASANSDGTFTFSGLTEGVSYVAYQATPDRYVNFTVESRTGANANDPAHVVTDSTAPLLVGSASASKGYQQLTSTAASATIASLCSGSALPIGATKCMIRPTATVRFRDDGTNPSSSVGFPVNAGETLDYDGDQLSALRVYGAATLDVWFRA